MPTCLVIANQKGGVGKTTTSVNLAASLALLGKRTLLVDLDPQGNATMGSGIDKRLLERSIYHVLIGECSACDVIVQSETGGYALMPANRELAGAEIELVDMHARERRLRMSIDSVAEDYDVVLIDSPPSLSMLTLNGLCAADAVVIPMQCEYYALEGLSDLVTTIRKVHANFNESIQIFGILRVMFDPRITLAQQVSAQLEQHFGRKVFRTVIPRNVRLAEAPSHGLPGVCFDASSRGSKAYLEFAAEVIDLIDVCHDVGNLSATSNRIASASSKATSDTASSKATSDAASSKATSGADPTHTGSVEVSVSNTEANRFASEFPGPVAPGSNRDDDDRAPTTGYSPNKYRSSR